MDEKIEDLLKISINVSDKERSRSPDLSSGYDDKSKTWEIIIKYHGQLETILEAVPQGWYHKLSHSYAVLQATREALFVLSQHPQIDYIEKPKQLYEEMIHGKRQCCMTDAWNRPIQSLHGQGVAVAIIDSGIEIQSPDFRNPDGSTRIRALWDQSAEKTYDKSQLDELLSMPVASHQNPKTLPGADLSGHGTAVAHIACGNRGIADKAEIIAVKLGVSHNQSFPRTTQLMEAVDYAVGKAIEWNLPLAVNISFGNNYGDHFGTSMLESYLDDIAFSGKSVICVGTGNEGLGATHVSGTLESDSEKWIELAIDAYEMSLSIQIWKAYWDELEVELVTPTGKRIGRITAGQSLQRIEWEGTKILGFCGEPSYYSMQQEIYLEFQGTDTSIVSGVWRIGLLSSKVKSGRYDMWLPALGTRNKGTGFLYPDVSMSLTIPSTASHVISVGAYDAYTDSYAPFSGRGMEVETWNARFCKPDLVAPGVNVVIDEFQKKSGTSFATPFVTGAAALMMEWGIVKGNDPYLYGEKVKAYLIKGARQLPGMETPNPMTGWGALCVRDSLPL